jgi:hypothetical protein
MVQHGRQEPTDVGFVLFAGSEEVLAISAADHAWLSVDLDLI